jgi:hypothetical protein
MTPSARKDRTLSEELKRRMSEVRKGRPAHNRKAVSIDGVIYPSTQAAADALGLPAYTVRHRIVSDLWENYSYVGEP